ncbi:hypothetical protein AXF42_Ash006664 [Apostasia shenzhenica]|uniref:Uncharacterized protein n=1 Tax=Apostasia shenzhenica TaxID=1088818 RepID=A0A2I0AIR7_9ASPA|nr:hypothetical protein AXF42_Ash006664 [Apostasia shenzhenica]
MSFPSIDRARCPYMRAWPRMQTMRPPSLNARLRLVNAHLGGLLFKRRRRRDHESTYPVRGAPLSRREFAGLYASSTKARTRPGSSRRGQSVGIHTISPVENTITLADDKPLPVANANGAPSSSPSTTAGVVGAPAQDQGTSVAASTLVGRVAGSAAPTVQALFDASGTGLVSQVFARTICRRLDQIKERASLDASEEQVTAIEQKLDEALALLRRLESTEAEKTIVDLELKCVRQERDLEAVSTRIEQLQKEKAAQ